LVSHFLIAHHFREHVANRCVVSGLDRVVHRPQDDLVACSQRRECFSDLALISNDFLSKTAFHDACLGDLKSSVAGRTLNLSGSSRGEKQDRETSELSHSLSQGRSLDGFGCIPGSCKCESVLRGRDLSIERSPGIGGDQIKQIIFDSASTAVAHSCFAFRCLTFSVPQRLYIPTRCASNTFPSWTLNRKPRRSFLSVKNER